MKYLLFLLASVGPFAMTASAQQALYDIITYHVPKSWKQEPSESYVSFSKIDGGSWAQIAIYKSTASKGSVEVDSQREWDAIVLAAHAVENQAQTKPERAEGWSVMSRSGVWQHEGTNVATVLTTYSNGQVCVSILCNATAQPYLRDYQQLISTLTLDATLHGAGTPAANNPAIVGLWTSAINETAGYSNGMPLTTGGYFRKEYRFHADGTYAYRAKNWSATVQGILFIHETGTYAVKGDRLTITPANGSGQWWNKAASGRTEGWGTYQGAHQHPLETTGYTFRIKYLSGMGEHYLILNPSGPTARDGSQGHGLQEFNYGRIDTGHSLIDNPPTR